MGFGIRPGMTTWNSMSSQYKKEYHIFAAKVEKRKFENDRKLMQNLKGKKLVGIDFNASMEEKNWFSWMEY